MWVEIEGKRIWKDGRTSLTKLFDLRFCRLCGERILKKNRSSRSYSHTLYCSKKCQNKVWRRSTKAVLYKATPEYKSEQSKYHRDWWNRHKEAYNAKRREAWKLKNLSAK